MMGHLCGFTGHNLRHTFATIVTEESGDLTVAMQLIRDKVPGGALGYVERDLPTLLERYSPVRQLERKPSPLVGESLVETGEGPTDQQLTFLESRWIKIGSIAWLKRVA